MPAQETKFDVFEVMVPIVRIAKVLVVARSPEQAKAYVQYKAEDGALDFLSLKDDEMLHLSELEVFPAANRDTPLWKLLRERSLTKCEIVGAKHSGYKAHELSGDEKAEIMMRAEQAVLRNVKLREELAALTAQIDVLITGGVGQRIIENSSPEELIELDALTGDTFASLRGPMSGQTATMETLNRLGEETDINVRTELVRGLPALVEGDTAALQDALGKAKALYENLSAKANASAN